eukprot:103334_1
MGKLISPYNLILFIYVLRLGVPVSTQPRPGNVETYGLFNTVEPLPIDTQAIQLIKQYNQYPNSVEARFLIGDLLKKLGRYGLAKKEYWGALQLGDRKGLVKIKELYTDLNSLPVIYAAMAESSFETWNNDEVESSKAPDRTESMALFDKALTEHPRSLPFLQIMSKIYDYYDRKADKDKLQPVIEELTNAAKLLEMSTVAFNNKNYEEARGLLEQSINVASDWQPAHNRLLYIKQVTAHWDGYKKAIKDMDTFLSKSREIVEKMACPKMLGSNLVCSMDLMGISDFGMIKERQEFQRRAAGILSHAVLLAHSSNQFEIFLYSTQSRDRSDVEGKFLEIEHFRNLHGMSKRGAVQRIRMDKLDILVDVDGYANYATRIGEAIMMRSAPVQISWLAFMMTTGMKNEDYIITDKVISPSSDAKFYSEKFINLPISAYPNSHRSYFTRNIITDQPAESRNTRCGFPAGTKFVYSSFNQIAKLNPWTLGSWMNILKVVPNSVLWLVRFPDMSPEVLERLKLFAERNAIDRSRIVLADWEEDPQANLDRQSSCTDVVLDPGICNGHTTLVDAIYAGIPVVTLPLNHMAGKVGASMLNAIGASNFAASSWQAYISIASRLGLDRDFYKSARQLFVDAHKSQLFDYAAYTLHLEAAYLHVWRRWLAGKPPTHTSISVDDARTSKAHLDL